MKKRKPLNRRKLPILGFTLIELLVVVSIISILAGLLLVNLQNIRGRARDLKRKHDLNEVKKALRLYYNDNQSYPQAGVSGNIGEGCGGGACTWGVSTFGFSGNTYMQKLPEDPLDDNPQYYYEQTDSENFTLSACLENQTDSSGVSCSYCGSQLCYQVKAD